MQYRELTPADLAKLARAQAAASSVHFNFAHQPNAPPDVAGPSANFGGPSANFGGPSSSNQPRPMDTDGAGPSSIGMGSASGAGPAPGGAPTVTPTVSFGKKPVQ